MAKQRRTSTRKTSTGRSSQLSNATSSIETNSFIKGMVKDTNASFQGKDTWAHARNAANNSTDGDVGTLGNEPANLQCATVPYTIIGAIHLYADQWVVYSTDDTNSEIGTFDDSECKYETLVNDPCLGFNREHLITGASKENFDCTWQVYWDDALNPSRTMNVDDVPFIQIEVQPPGADCVIYEDTDRLDCEKLRLAPLLKTPCVELFNGNNAGQLKNGSYQAYVAYLVNGQRVSDYIGISNLQSLFDHQGTSGSLDIRITNLEENSVQEYELVILINNQNQIFAKRIGTYSVHQTDINLTFIDPELEDIKLGDLVLNRPTYERSEEMYVVNDYLIRSGPVGQFDFNYQPLANQIQAEYVVAEVPSDYYYKGGNAVGFMRDEVYSFFIRWIYNTGERSASYHIPGRPLNTTFSYRNGTANFLEGEDANVAGPNAIDTGITEQAWQVFNTALPPSFPTTPVFGGAPAQNDTFRIIGDGIMGYWESTERYPNKPEVFNSNISGRPELDLCNQPIRHHRIPSEEVAQQLHLNTPDGETIRIVGVQFNNILRPVDNDGDVIPNIVGYEILRGSRENNKSILAKGIFRNMREYKLRKEDDITGLDLQAVYPNYPYNELDNGPGDVFFHTGQLDQSFLSNVNKTFGADSYDQSINKFDPLTGYKKDIFTFHSPDLMFTRPFLNAYETRMYGEKFGFSTGAFIPTEKHPKQKLLRNPAAIISAILGTAFAVSQVAGLQDKQRLPIQGLNIGFAGLFPRFTNGTSQIPFLDVNRAMAAPAAKASNLRLQLGSNAAKSKLAVRQGINAAVTAGEIAIGDFFDQMVAGGIVGDIGDIALSQADARFAAGQPGTMGGGTIEVDNGTKFKSLPAPVRVATSIPVFLMNATTGGQEIVELIYNFMSPKAFAYKYNSHGFYGNYRRLPVGDRFRSRNTASNYIGESFQIFGDLNNQVKINNLKRPDTVAIQTLDEFNDPQNIDDSRISIGRYSRETIVDDPNAFDIYFNPSNSIRRNISALYGALKFNLANQYGQLENIKQVPMRDCLHLIDSTKPDQFLYSTKPIFSGDTYVGRYTEKVIMPIFSFFTKDLPDEFPYDYLKGINIPYPRYWMDSKKYDLSEIVDSIGSSIQALLDNGNGFDSGMPNNLYYLDRHPFTVNGQALINSNSPSDIDSGEGPINVNTGVSKRVMPRYAMDNSYMYTHINGVQDFFVESEINLAQRDHQEPPARRFYDIYKYNDLKTLFHSDIVEEGNFYLYDYSLSASHFVTNLTSQGAVQERDYDPQIAETCYTSYPKRLIYSLRAQEESKRDFWRVFLPNNYRDFVNEVTVIKPINKTGAIMLFPYQSPTTFTGVDQLQTDLDTKVTLGDGGLFNQAFQNIVNAEVGYEHGSCESARSVINTPSGVFYISQAQGKIFQYTGQLVNIANQGMKWWFNKYLPSTLIRQFPEFEESILADNPVVGIGCQSIYDANDDIVYFCKKDYKVREEYLDNISYTLDGGFVYTGPIRGVTPPPPPPDDPTQSNPIGVADPSALIGVPIELGDFRYFEDTSWTVSYDPKAKAWISFHDWHPELTLPSINHFLTTKTTTSDRVQCPPGYSFDPVQGDCVQLINETAPAIVDIDFVNNNTGTSQFRCPSGYIRVYLDANGEWTSPTPQPGTGAGKFICKRVTCNCPPPPANTTVTEYGDCDDVYLAGSTGYVNQNPRICNYFSEDRQPSNFKTGGFWRHNVRCDLYANFYGQNYPWEVELVETHGQIVDTLRSLEYQLESYVYSGDLYNACADDRWHDLDFNFDELIIHNTEQVSGLLRLNINPKNDPFGALNYPIINSDSIDVLYSKEEQKYRINQFYDVTRDRGEFTLNVQETIFDTQSNGYIKTLNPNNLDYTKAETEHKKFRHYFNKVLLRRRISADKKMLLKVHNSKLLYSFR